MAKATVAVNRSLHRHGVGGGQIRSHVPWPHFGEMMSQDYFTCKVVRQVVTQWVDCIMQQFKPTTDPASVEALIDSYQPLSSRLLWLLSWRRAIHCPMLIVASSR